MEKAGGQSRGGRLRCRIPHRELACVLPGLAARYIVAKGGLRTASRRHAASFSRKPQRQPQGMAADVSKHLDRAKRFLERNRIEDAISAYRAVLDEAPQHQEATQALGDLYARADQPDRAAVYYGQLFDMLVEPRDESKALAIYNRFLRSSSE